MKYFTIIIIIISIIIIIIIIIAIVKANKAPIRLSFALLQYCILYLQWLKISGTNSSFRVK